MSTPGDPLGAGPERRLTLDLAGLSEEEREQGSMYLGGSAKKFVVPGDDFTYEQVLEVAFNWGDPVAEEIFGEMLAYDDRFKGEKEFLFPFLTAARLGDDLWELAIQTPDFDPEKVYREASHYVEIPYDAETGYRVLHDALSIPRPGPEMIGKVGVAWVLFSGAVSLVEPNFEQYDAENSPETGEIGVDELLSYAEQLIADHDFERSSDEDNNRFATHMVFWLLETFAQQNIDGEYKLYPHHKMDGFDGEILPDAIKPLMLHFWQNEPHYFGSNEVMMESDYQFDVIREASLPIDPGDKTFQQILDHFKEHPEDVNGIRQEVVGYLPQVKLTYQPDGHNGWDIEYLVSPAGIKIMPLIRNSRGSTAKSVPDYQIQAMTHPAELAKSVSELALLAARYTDHVTSGRISMERLFTLQARLAGEEPLPLIKGREYESSKHTYFVQLPTTGQ